MKVPSEQSEEHVSHNVPCRTCETGHLNALLNKESKLKTEIKGKEISNRGQTVFSPTIFKVIYLFIQLRYTYLFFRVDN